MDQVDGIAEGTANSSGRAAELLRLVESEWEGRWFRVLGRGTVSMAAVVVVGEVVRSLTGLSTGGIIGGLSVAVASISASGWCSRRQREALAELGRLEDLRALGPLLDASSFRRFSPPTELRTALTRLLGRLNSPDQVRLTDAQIESLDDLLRLEEAKKDPDFCLAVLHSISVIGSTSAIKTVGKIAEGKGALGQSPQVREAARECAKSLEARRQDQEARERLLRPSRGGDETLLHVPANAGRPETETLLHVVDGDSG